MVLDAVVIPGSMSGPTPPLVADTLRAFGARNLMREVEIFLPLLFLIAAQVQGFSNRWLTLFGFG